MNLPECPYCHTTFVNEKNLAKHNCKQKKRAAEIRTPLGQQAYDLYNCWMVMNTRNPPNIMIFTTSKFYTYFINFANYANEMKLDIEVFLELMVLKDISPSMWRHEKAYTMYLEHIDRRVGPMRQANITIKTLFRIATFKDKDISEIFEFVSPNEVLQLLRERRISPWILMNSAKFKDFMVKKCTPEQQLLFKDQLHPMFWKQQFDKNPEILKQIKKYVSEIGL